MPIVAANGIDIAYDEVGDKSAPAIVLIMGLGTQMISWPEVFCAGLADRGFRVIRFDNRDIGLSTKIETAPPVDLATAIGRAMAGKPINPPYTLNDMAVFVIAVTRHSSIAVVVAIRSEWPFMFSATVKS